MYSLFATSKFQKDLNRVKKDKNIESKIVQAIERLLENPFNTSLKTHLVNTPSLGKVYSSRVTGDLRMLWEFSENNKLVIIALKLQGHDTVYN